MTDDEILAEFRAAEALLEGHFILSSGLRSRRYLQCARVLMDPARASRLASAATTARELRQSITAVVSRRWRVISGHEWGRSGVKRCSSSALGFFGLVAASGLEPGHASDGESLTTVLSSRESIAALDSAGGTVVAAPASSTIGKRRVDLGSLHRALASSCDLFGRDLPPDLAAIPAIKPGSRAAA